MHQSLDCPKDAKRSIIFQLSRYSNPPFSVTTGLISFSGVSIGNFRPEQEYLIENPIFCLPQISDNPKIPNYAFNFSSSCYAICFFSAITGLISSINLSINNFGRRFYSKVIRFDPYFKILIVQSIKNVPLIMFYLYVQNPILLLLQINIFHHGLS